MSCGGGAVGSVLVSRDEGGGAGQRGRAHGRDEEGPGSEHDGEPDEGDDLPDAGLWRAERPLEGRQGPVALCLPVGREGLVRRERERERERRGEGEGAEGEDERGLVGVAEDEGEREGGEGPEGEELRGGVREVLRGQGEVQGWPGEREEWGGDAHEFPAGLAGRRADLDLCLPVPPRCAVFLVGGLGDNGGLLGRKGLVVAPDCERELEVVRLGQVARGEGVWGVRGEAGCAQSVSAWIGVRGRRGTCVVEARAWARAESTSESLPSERERAAWAAVAAAVAAMHARTNRAAIMRVKGGRGCP